jgi:hypothetical protein
VFVTGIRFLVAIPRPGQFTQHGFPSLRYRPYGPDEIDAALMLLQLNAAQPHMPSRATRERGRRYQSRQYHQHRIPGQLMLIMKLGPPPGRNETGIPRR